MRRRNPGFLLLAAAAASGACQRSEPTFGAEHPVPPSRPVELGKSQVDRLGIEPMGAGAAAVAGFAADAPAGWEAVPGSDMRQLNYKIAGVDDAQCYLTAGGLRGGVLGNVNRWFGQFGQPTLDAAALATLPRHLLLGREAVLVTIEGTFAGMGGGGGGKPDFKLLGLVAGVDDDTMTLKFTGPKVVVEQQREAFLQLAKSIRRGGGGAASPTAAGNAPSGAGAPTGAGNPSPHAAAGAPFTATIPADWQASAGSGMRLLRHRFGTQGECYVGMLGGTVADMLGIWYGEMKQTPPDAAAIAALPKTPMLGGEATLVDLQGDFAGTSGAIAGARVLVSVLADGGGVTFVKCVGPAAEVAAQRAAFVAFCASLKRNG